MNFECRTCLLASDGEMESLYSVKIVNDAKISIAEMIALCVGLEVSKHDLFTNFICQSCLHNLINAFNYRQTCWISHMMLLQQTCKQQNVKEEVQDITEIQNTIKQELGSYEENETNITNSNKTIIGESKQDSVKLEASTAIPCNEPDPPQPFLQNLSDQSDLSMNNFYLKTEKNKPTLLVDGFLFIRHGSYKGVTYWKCNDSSRKYCKARFHTNSENGIIKKIGDHNHAADASDIALRITKAELNQKAQSTNENIELLIAEYSSKLPDAVKSHMPSMNSLKRTIQRIRQSQKIIPLSLTELCVLDQYKVTKDNKPFLLYDSGPTDKRFLLFSTEENLNCLCRTSDWYIGVTLNNVPSVFKQFFIIHGVMKTLTLPLAYALLPNQAFETITVLFTQLKSLCPNLNPTFIMSDVDQAIINAIQYSFPRARHRFCFFPFARTIYHKLDEAGFKTRYDQEPTFAHRIRMLVAIAFVPPGDVIEVFDSVKSRQIFPEDIDEVVDYFEEHYIGKLDVMSGKRDPPTYAVQTWNFYEAAMLGLSQANFDMVWYNAFARSVGAKHCSLWSFLEHLQLEQSKNEKCIRQFFAGSLVPPKKRKYRIDQRLKDIVSKYSTMNLVEFLSGVAYIITI